MNTGQAKIQLLINKKIEFSEEELECLKYLAEELEEWKKIKNTKA